MKQKKLGMNKNIVLVHILELTFYVASYNEKYTLYNKRNCRTTKRWIMKRKFLTEKRSEQCREQ